MQSIAEDTRAIVVEIDDFDHISVSIPEKITLGNLLITEGIKENVGQLAATTTADAGYFSAANIEHAALAETNLLVPPSRIKHGAEPVMGSNKPDASPAEKMRYKLAQPEGSELYKMRKAIVEPVFGQIKEVRDIRRFRMRGFTAANQEFSFIALTHNVLKLFRSAISIV